MISQSAIEKSRELFRLSTDNSKETQTQECTHTHTHGHYEENKTIYAHTRTNSM